MEKQIKSVALILSVLSSVCLPSVLCAGRRRTYDHPLLLLLPEHRCSLRMIPGWYWRGSCLHIWRFWQMRISHELSHGDETIVARAQLFNNSRQSRDRLEAISASIVEQNNSSIAGKLKNT